MIINGRDVTEVNTCKITDMSYLLSLYTEWNVSFVTNMRKMSSSTQVFNQSIGEWNISNVTNMSWMFSATQAFNQPIGEWDVSNVIYMSEMFNSATSFNQNIKGWNVNNVLSSSLFATESSALEDKNNPFK